MRVQRLKAEVEAGGMAKGRGKGKGKAKADLLASSTNQASPTSNIQQQITSTRISVLSELLLLLLNFSIAFSLLFCYKG